VIINDPIKVEHSSRSGNRAGIMIPDHIRTGTYDEVKVVWDSAPTPEDLREYNEFHAKFVVPILVRQLENQTGHPQRVTVLGRGIIANVKHDPC
jgi:hypothetical protein